MLVQITYMSTKVFTGHTFAYLEKEHQDEYLDACLVLDGCRWFFNLCANLKCESHLSTTATPSFRCQECFGYGVYCKEYIVSAHILNLLHRIEVRDPVSLRIVNLYTWLVGMENTFLQANFSLRLGSSHSARTQTRIYMPLPTGWA